MVMLGYILRLMHHAPHPGEPGVSTSSTNGGGFSAGLERRTVLGERSVDGHAVDAGGLGDRLEERRTAGPAVTAAPGGQAERD